MTYSVATNEKRAMGVLLLIFRYSPELEGLSRLSNLDVDESGAGRGEDGLCRTT